MFASLKGGGCLILGVSIGLKAGNPWMEHDRSSSRSSSSSENAFEEPPPEEPEWTVTDQNHEAILLMPDILARLVQLLTFDKLYFNREVPELSSQNCSI